MSHGHGAAVVSGPDELLAVALPFLDAGLRAGLSPEASDQIHSA